MHFCVNPLKFSFPGSLILLPLTKFPHKFAGLKQPEPPEKISPISVASEQALDTSLKASIQRAATKVTDRLIAGFTIASV